MGNGCCNSLSQFSDFSVIVGGNCNFISAPYANDLNFIGGGAQNCILGIHGAPVPANASVKYNFLGAGFCNCIVDDAVLDIPTSYSFLGSGLCNTVCASLFNGIMGGFCNTVCNDYSNIVTGCNNLITDIACNSSILAGQNNTICAPFGSILGGCNNVILNPAGGGHPYSAIFGCNLVSCAPHTFHVECLNAVNTPVGYLASYPPGTIFRSATPPPFGTPLYII